MAINVSIDPDFINRALEVTGERSEKASVTKALQGIYRTMTVA